MKIMKTTITPALTQELSERFPQKCPLLGTPMERIWYEAGQASVVAFLLEQQSVQERQSNTT